LHTLAQKERIIADEYRADLSTDNALDAAEFEEGVKKDDR